MEVVPNAREVFHYGDTELRKKLPRTDTRELQNLWTAWSTSRDDDFLGCLNRIGRTTTSRHILLEISTPKRHLRGGIRDSHRQPSSLLVLVEEYLGNGMSSEQMEIRSGISDTPVVGRRRCAPTLVPEGQGERGVYDAIGEAVVGLGIRRHTYTVPTTIKVLCKRLEADSAGMTRRSLGFRRSPVEAVPYLGQETDRLESWTRQAQMSRVDQNREILGIPPATAVSQG